MLTIELATPRTRGAYWYNCEWNVEESNIKAAMENSSAKRDSSGIDGMKLSEWERLCGGSRVLQQINRTASVSEIERETLAVFIILFFL